jgi:hypothetical protein
MSVWAAERSCMRKECDANDTKSGFK